MAAEPVYAHLPDMITLRQAEALTGINYQDIYEAARHKLIHSGRYNTIPTFRVSKKNMLAWAASRSETRPR